MKIYLKLFIILTLLFHLSCFDIIGSNNVFELNNLTLTLTDTESTNYHWKVNGTVVNTGDTTVLAPWYIEAMFYSDSTFIETFGGDSERMNFPLEPGVTSYWSLHHHSDAVLESDYPNFVIKDLRAFIKK